MPFTIWTLDVAREQSLSLDHLYQYAALTQEAGYDAIGLYLEHRYAYRATPWAHGKGCITPQMIQSLQSEFPSLKIVPFINLLGHFEGFLYTEEGKQYREELFRGLQACPSNPAFVTLCEQILDETMEVFQSDLIHIGGDETNQLNACERCKSESEGQEDPKAFLYNRHFGPLAERVVRAGRRPGVWGDMFLEHPEALATMPKETLIFDWQYFNGVAESARTFEGFEVIGCPAFHVYNAPWLHIPQTEQNVREVSRDVRDGGLAGVCVTTWESGLFGAMDTLFPGLRWAAAASRDPDVAQTLLEAQGDAREWADLMGVQLPKLGKSFHYSKIRSGLKCRLLLYGNPFLAWMHHGEELAGPVGDEALALCEKALAVAPSEAEKGVTLFIRGAVEFVRMAEKARLEYRQGNADAAIGQLAPTRYLFETLERVAERNVNRIGGSLADIERCKAARKWVEVVIQRIRNYGRGELGYLPAFEVITNPRFMPHDQACWWLINSWANQ